MKKVLFATTALVATSGFAAADVTLSGVAQMGIMGGENMDVQFVQDIDVTFTMSGETDNGLTFGAAIDLDESAGAVGTDDAGVAIFISGNFGTLTMGDTDGAMDWALQDAGIGPASINDDHTVHAGYNGNNQFDANAPAGAAITDMLAFSFDLDADSDEAISIDVASDDLGNAFGWGGILGSKWEMFLDGEVDIEAALFGYDGQILRYDYSVGGFGVAVSVQIDDDEVLDPMWGIGATYETAAGAGTFTAGVAYQSGEIGLTLDATPSIQFWGEWTNTEYLVPIGTTNLITAVGDFDGAGISLGYEVNGFEVVGNFTRHEISFGGGLDIEIDHAAIGFAYTVDALSLGVNWGQYDVSALGMSDNITGWGLAAAYDLGGGASIHFGYGDGETFGVEEDSTWSFGLNMAF
ncbi:porin [Rhodobacterales bacterium HKCCSP123]|nr:porin [Rhodobacterales bacterium HKCCSP123]